MADRGGLLRFVGQDFTVTSPAACSPHGFARLACLTCRAEVLVPFSDDSRAVCLS